MGGFQDNDGKPNTDMEDEWVGEKERKIELFRVRFWVLPSSMNTMQHSVTALISCQNKG